MQCPVCGEVVVMNLTDEGKSVVSSPIRAPVWSEELHLWISDFPPHRCQDKQSDDSEG